MLIPVHPEDLEPTIGVGSNIKAHQMVAIRVQLGPSANPAAVGSGLPGVPDVLIPVHPEDLQPTIGVSGDLERVQIVAIRVQLGPSTGPVCKFE